MYNVHDRTALLYCSRLYYVPYTSQTIQLRIFDQAKKFPGVYEFDRKLKKNR